MYLLDKDIFYENFFLLTLWKIEFLKRALYLYRNGRETFRAVNHGTIIRTYIIVRDEFMKTQRSIAFNKSLSMLIDIVCKIRDVFTILPKITILPLFRENSKLLKMGLMSTYEWHTDGMQVHTSDIRMTYQYIRVTYGWHASTYDWQANDIWVYVGKIWAHTNNMQMTCEWHKKY